MTSSVRKTLALAATSSVFLLSACGGGGGSTADSSASATQTASTITSSNAPAVTAQAYASSSGLNNQASTGSKVGSSLVTGVSVDTKSVGIIGAAIHGLYAALKVQPENLVTGVITSNSINCPGGGTMLVSLNFASSTTVSNGDSMTVDSSNCIDGSWKLNGGMSIAFSNVSGTPSSSTAWGATMKMTFTNFSVTEGTVTDKANGDLTLVFNQDAVGNQTFSASGTSLQTATIGSGNTVNYTLTNYSYSGSATSTNLYTYRANFTVAGNLPNLGNNVSYVVKTTTDFKQQGTNYPHQGVMTVTATDNTSLTLTALSSTSVQIDIDKNGDGTIDETTTKTWAEISSLI